MNWRSLFQIILLKLERVAWRVLSVAKELLQEIISSKNMNIKRQHSLISWSVLPTDLLHLVSIRLHLCDHLNFRSVCVAWRAAAAAASVMQFCHGSPFLLRDLLVDNNCRSFICPFHGKCYRLSLPGFYKKYTCRNSSHGWLVMIDRYSEEIFLLNPFTGARVDLPRCNRFRIRRIELSSAPTEPNCTVIMLEEAVCGFKFCRVGDDEWKVESFSPALPHNALVFKMKLYLLCFPNHSLSDTEATIAAANTATHFKLAFLTRPSYSLVQSTHLVESGEELLLVIRYFKEGLPLCNNDFAVFKFDIRNSSWVWMKKIGNRVLFLGDKDFGYYSGSFSATEMGCKGNQIYFQYYHYLQGPGYTWWVFNMDDRSIKPASWNSFSVRAYSFGLIGITPSFV